MPDSSQTLEPVFRSIEGARIVRERYLELLGDWPVANEHMRIDTREGETFVIASGPGDGPPLVLLHGMGINSIMWKGDIAALSERHRVYAVDLIGEPGLSAPSRPRLDSDAHALWLDDVLDGLKATRPTLLGASLGGWVALDYAIRRTDRVARLVLACPGGVGRIRPGFLFTAVPFLRCGEWGRRRAMRILLGVDLLEEPPEARVLGSYMMLVFKHFRPRTDPLTTFPDEALGRLTMPVLAVVGGRDAIFDSSDTRRRLETCVPHAEIVDVPDAGHALMDQQAPILDFLDRTAVPAGRASEP